MLVEGPCFHNSLKEIFLSSTFLLLISMNLENKSFFGARVAEDEGTSVTAKGKDFMLKESLLVVFVSLSVSISL